MKHLITALLLALTLCACSKDCEEQSQALDRQYQQSLQHAATPEAREEITRQYNQAKANLDC